MSPRNTSNWRNPPPEKGCLLVATPMLTDPNFSRAVVYLLEHDGGGTVGVVLNRPSHTPVGQVLPDWHDVMTRPAVVFSGGPVEPDGALCLGRLSGDGPGVSPLVDGVGTVDLDAEVGVVTATATQFRVYAGHSGWSPGQLTDELDEGAWWVLDGGPHDVFSDEPKTLWQRVLRRQPPPLNLVSTYPPEIGVN